MDTVATIAMLNNPDLKAARARARVGVAQAFAAGIPPNPQLSGSRDLPTGGVAGLVTAYSLGLALDLQSLITQPLRAGAAHAARDQALLDLLWQEWQTVAMARTLYVSSYFDQGKREYLAQADANFTQQNQGTERALQAGDIGLDQAGGDVAVLADIRSRQGAAQRSALQADQALRALLGLTAEVPMPLLALAEPAVPDHDAVAAGIARLPGARPDLLALQAGYRSQERRLHQAVLAQFPGISVAFGSARDTSDIHTRSLGVTLNLPLFDHGQRDIAVQRATREQLRAEYQARLDLASADAWRLWSEAQQLQLQIREASERLPQLQRLAVSSAKAYAARDITATTYLTTLSTVLNSQTELFDLRASLWSDVIALGTVLGTQVEPVTAAQRTQAP
ncbi:MAG: TolC family protein [Gammaproteobacteria bacterium]|nr:TolC family protein [Gammaproteobacteria bacterium]